MFKHRKIQFILVLTTLTSWATFLDCCCAGPPSSAERVRLLIEAADVDGLQREIAGGADVEQAPAALEMRPLQMASWFNVPEAVELLLANHADINGRDAEGVTAVQIALQRPARRIVDILVKRGADLHTVDITGRTCLHFAAAANDIEHAQLLIDRGCDVNAREADGTSVLDEAVGSSLRADSLVTLLIEKGAAVDVKNKRLESPLHSAVTAGGLTTVRILLENGGRVTSIDGDGQTPLHTAARRGDPEIVRLLLRYGAARSAKDKMGRTPLDVARLQHRDKVVELLKPAA